MMVSRLILLLFLFSSLGMTIAVSSSKVVGADFQGTAKPTTTPTTRTVVADLLMIDGNFYVVRGERGEIRIEVTPDTILSDTFKFGDRIKAVILPNDEALSMAKAAPEDPIGITINEPASSPKPKTASPPASPPPSKPPEGEIQPEIKPQNRIVVADLLMVDGNFYIVRTERGEIQIEITPQTQLAEKFKFGDRIKALIKPDDEAISVERASAHEPSGIRTVSETGSQAPSSRKETGSVPAPSQGQDKAPTSPPKVQPAQTKTIIAEILMVDGDFYVVRGDRGEIRIEITPKTQLTEQFKFGDKIKAVVLPNDQAVSVERAPR